MAPLHVAVERELPFSQINGVEIHNNIYYNFRSILDAYSEMIVDSSGLVSRHKMDRVIPAPKERNLVEAVLRWPLNALRRKIPTTTADTDSYLKTNDKH